MVPYEKANDFFGFFSVFGRFAGIFSPFLIAFFQSEDRLGTNNAVLLLLVPLVIAVILLLFVKPPLKDEGFEDKGDYLENNTIIVEGEIIE